MARKSQTKELLERDPSARRQGVDPLSIKRRGWAHLIDYYDNAELIMEWDLNDTSKEQGLFRLVIPSRSGKDRREVAISKEQLQFYLRNV